MQGLYRSHLILPALALALLSGCGEPAADAEREALKVQVAALQTQFEEVQEDLNRSGDEARLADLERRVADYEKSSGDTIQGFNEAFAEQNERLNRMVRSFSELDDIIQAGQTWVTFGLGYEGHAVARTPHGSFLIELQDQKEVEGGFQLNLRIGNATNLQVHQFRIYGEFGAPPPKWDEEQEDYQSYVGRVNTWEGGLKSFDKAFVQELMPDSWNNVELTIPAERLADLSFIRLRLDVERASLRRQDADAWAVVGADFKGATILETRYGSFPLTVSRVKEGDGYFDLVLLVGNPLGMTITSSTFAGSFGPAPPTMADAADPDDYSQKLVIWDRLLQPFEVKPEEELVPYHWNEVTLRLPTDDREKLKYIRLTMDVHNVSLRNRE